MRAGEVDLGEALRARRGIFRDGLDEAALVALAEDAQDECNVPVLAHAVGVGHDDTRDLSDERGSQKAAWYRASWARC